jgi:hypothetical protein
MRFDRRPQVRWLVPPCLAAAISACGGTDHTERPERPKATNGGSALDFASCQDVVDAFEFRSIESFDDGSVQDDGNRAAGWWVSTDGTNDFNYHPWDTHFESNVQITADFFPTQPDRGAAPALTGGDAVCEPSVGYMKLL